MPSGSNKDVIEELRLHSDIVETIERYVPLKKAGGRFKACCPFHKEKTPSFHVDPTKQLYHCFGCGAGGDVFSFVMQYENVAFPEAARILAERAGIRFEQQHQDQPSDGIDKSSLYRLHEELAQFYANTLEKHADAQKARAYLKERDLDAARGDFQLGFAPPQTGAVMEWAQQRKHAPALLEKAGVLLPSDRGGAPYDRFRGRLMFPIRDEQGRVVGFSGRILDQSSQAKYVNSPETALFKKSRLLYGLDRARQHMTQERRAVVCEGQIDVIRCHLAGICTAVAPQGTALTEAHALLLKRYADEVVLVFDSDTAGQNATLRGAEMLLQVGLTMRVTALPPGDDPDTIVRKQGAEAMKSMINSAHSMVTFQVGILRERGELDTQAGQLRAARAVLETIAHAPGAVQREQYIRESAECLKISEDALRQDMMRMLRPGRARQPEERTATPAPTHPAHEAGLIELIIAHPEVLNIVHQYVPPEAITDPDCRRILETIMAEPDLDHINLVGILADSSETCRRLVARLQMTARAITGTEVSCTHAAQDIILALRIKLLDRQIRECLDNMKTATGHKKRELVNESAQLTVLKKRMQEGWNTAEPILELDK